MLDFKRPPKVALAAALLATCALAGCVVGPNYHAPPSGALGVPQAYGIAAAPAQPVDITVWWKQLNDPLLTELIDRATADNLDIAVSRSRLVAGISRRMKLKASWNCARSADR